MPSPEDLPVGFPCGSGGKESPCNVGDLGSIPGLGRSPGEGKSYPLQYSGLENSVHGSQRVSGQKSNTKQEDSKPVWVNGPNNQNST